LHSAYRIICKLLRNFCKEDWSEDVATSSPSSYSGDYSAPYPLILRSISVPNGINVMI
jgi:hypothetical protein